MDRIINIYVGGNHISKDCKNAGVKGEANVTFLRITFDPGWDEYAKYITFWDARGENPVKMLLAITTENVTEEDGVYLVTIPSEPMAVAGMLTYVIDGFLGNKIQRSISDTLEVKDAPAAYDANDPAEPTPTELQQMQAQIEGLREDILKAINARDDIANMQVNAETLPSGENATVQKHETEDGSFALHFGIPEGKQGLSPSAKVTQTPAGAYIEITDKDGTTSTPIFNGAAGVGIASIENRVASDQSGGENLIWVTFTDGSTQTFTIKNGEKGTDGVGISSVEQVVRPEGGGEDNVIFVRTTDSNVYPIFIKNGEKGEPFKYEDFTPEQLASLKGADGKSDSATYLDGYDFAYVFNNDNTIKDFVTNQENYIVGYASGSMMLTPITPTPYLYHTFSTPIDGSKCNYIKISYRFNRAVVSEQEILSTICFKTKQNPNFDLIHNYSFYLNSKTSGGNERFTVILPMGTGLNWSQGTITDIRLSMPDYSMVSLDTLYIDYIGFFQNLADAEAYEPTKPVKVVQTTGDSETAVMSQKAVTDLFTSALGRVDADVTGSAIFIDDMSPVFDELKVTVSGDYEGFVDGKEFLRIYGKNIIASEKYAGIVGESVNISGVDITRNADDTYTVNGTATEDITYEFVSSYVPRIGQVFLSGCPSGGSSSTYYLRHGMIGNDFGNGVSKTFTGNGSSAKFTINIKNGTTVNNLTFKPQVELGTKATEYEQPIDKAIGCSVNADGTINNVSAIRPNMSIINIRSTNLQINCKYIRDFGKVLNNLNEQVASISNQLLN